MIYFASLYEPKNHHGTVYNTAVGTRGMGRYKQLKFLAPHREIVSAHQDRAITDEQYLHGYEIWHYDDETRKPTHTVHVQGYYEILHENWPQIKAWLDSLKADEDITLLCYCPEWKQGKRKFCHRQIIYKLIWKHRPDLREKLVLH